MPRLPLFLSAALALSVATAAAAQTPSVAPADVTSTRSVKTGDPDRRVCKALTTTGSRLSRTKICKTAREWAEEQMRTQEDLQRNQSTRTPDQG